MLSCFPFSYQALTEDADYHPLLPLTGSPEPPPTESDVPGSTPTQQQAPPPQPPPPLSTPGRLRPLLIGKNDVPTLPNKAAPKHRRSLFGHSTPVSKGTEHLEQESLRKSNSPAISLADGQRYTKLPTPSSISRRPSSKSNEEPRLVLIPSLNSSSHSPASARRRPPPPRPSSTVAKTPSRPPPRPKGPHPGMMNHGDSSSSAPLPPRTDLLRPPPKSSVVAALVNKPARGWLHPDQKIADPDGVSYTVRYIGSLDINTSMRSLDFETRSLIAKECICRVCEDSGRMTADQRRQATGTSTTDNCNKLARIARMLGSKTNVAHTGTDVKLTVTSSFLNLTAIDSGEVIAKHEMPNISFASGGDADTTTTDFVAFVAKGQLNNTRACYVLECEQGQAQEVISTIGQAFELRFKEFILKRAPRNLSERVDQNPATLAREGAAAIAGDANNREREYYNDLPNKVPPEVPAASTTTTTGGLMVPKELKPPSVLPRASRSNGQESVATNLMDQPSSANLIDLTTDISCDSIKREPEYVNCDKPKSTISGTTGSSVCDPFDMLSPSDTFNSAQYESSAALGFGVPSSAPPLNTSGRPQPLLSEEEWFHGSISRKESETLLISDGDFLVRESQGSVGQYVLSGMQAGIRKHLLLVDPEGIVRTKDQTFDSVSHLINYHRDNGLPIISAESELILRTAVIAKRN